MSDKSISVAEKIFWHVMAIIFCFVATMYIFLIIIALFTFSNLGAIVITCSFSIVMIIICFKFAEKIYEKYLI